MQAKDYPSIQSWVNNSAVVLLSGVLSLVVSIWHQGVSEGARDHQVVVNTARLDAIEKYGSQGAREEIIRLHDRDTAMERHLEDIDKKLDRVIQQHSEYFDDGKPRR